MAPCIVKFCKNNSVSKNKRQGITFHRFPKNNEVWRKDLINIIRENRNDKDWLPSNSTVICSVHFNTEDLYATKTGRIRIATFAIPKNRLFEPLGMQKEQSAEPNMYNVLQQCLREERLFDPLDMQEAQSAEPNMSNALQQVQYLKEEKLFEPLDMREEQCAETNMSSPSQEVKFVKEESSSETEAAVSNLEEPLTTEQSSSLSSSLLLPQTQPEIGAATMEVNSEEPISISNALEQKWLKRKLMMSKEVIQRQKRKIKTLNRKVKRLEHRNKSLKDILKTLKDQDYIVTDLSNRLSTDIIVADLFRNYNRHKLNKQANFSTALKTFCLTLNYYSPKAYNYVRQTFNTCLPHCKTLTKWLRDDPGSTEESLTIQPQNSQSDESFQI